MLLIVFMFQVANLIIFFVFQINVLFFATVVILFIVLIRGFLPVLSAFIYFFKSGKLLT